MRYDSHRIGSDFCNGGAGRGDVLGLPELRFPFVLDAPPAVPALPNAFTAVPSLDPLPGRIRRRRLDERRRGQPAQRFRFVRFEGVGHAHQQHARLLSLSLDLHTQPALLLLREEVIGQSRGSGAAQKHAVLAVGVGRDVLRLLPDGCAAVLLLVDGEGDADGVSEKALRPARPSGFRCSG